MSSKRAAKNNVQLLWRTMKYKHEKISGEIKKFND